MSGPKAIKPAKPDVVRHAIRPLAPLQCAYVLHGVVDKLIADRAAFLAAGSTEAVDMVEQLLGLFKLYANEAVRL